MRFVLNVILFSVLAVFNVYSQQSNNSIFLTQQNGLPSNYVYDAFEDRKGFIWFATDLGLYRYDGFEYKLYASEMQSSLAGSCIQQDVFGRIWYENFDGYLFYLEDGKLNQIEQGNPIQFLPFGLTNKNLYVIVDKGVNIYDLKTLKLVKSIKIEWVYAEHANLIDDTFYITDQNKIVAIDATFNVFRTTVNVDASKGVKLIYALNNNLGVFYRNGAAVNIYDKKLRFLQKQVLNMKGTIHFLSKNGQKNYSLSTSKGLFKVFVDGLDFKITGVKYPGYSIAKSITDKNNDEWYPTVGNGVIFNSTSQSNVATLVKGNFSLIRPFDDGYIVADKEGKISTLSNDFSSLKALLNADSDIAYLFKDKDQKSFLYTNNLGLFVVQNGIKKHFNVALKQAVALDNKYYLVATSGFYGLFKNPFSTQKTSNWDKYFTRNIFNLEDFSAFRSFVRAKTVAYNANLNVIVAGTNIGTFVNKEGVEQEIKYNNKPFFVNKLVWCYDVLFALSTAGDLYKIENLNRITKIDIPENGLRLAKHANHFIYMLGGNFLYAYDTRKNTTTKYNLDFNTKSINDFIINDNELIVASVLGLIKIDLKAIVQRKLDVPFYVNDLYVNGVKTSSLKNLNYNQNNIRINFSYLNYSNKNGVVVSYRLNDDAWVLVRDKERDVYFQSLAPGDYTLSFKVNEKVINEKVRISVAVPIWEAWWFYLFVFTLVLFVLAIYFTAKTRLYTKQIKLLNEKILLEKNLGKSVLTSIKAQMNPHFFYNALNTIQAFIFTNDKLSANNYLAKFSKLTRLILEMSEKEIVSLNEELDFTKMYLDLEKMRFGAKFNYSINVKNISNTEMVELPPMLVQPLIENAIKHGLLHLNEPGKLNITYTKVDEYLLIEVDDNGIGREQSTQLKNKKNKAHNSFAIKANQTRLDILNKDRAGLQFTLQIIDKYEQGVAAGTTARLTIPLN